MEGGWLDRAANEVLDSLCVGGWVGKWVGGWVSGWVGGWVGGWKGFLSLTMPMVKAPGTSAAPLLAASMKPGPPPVVM